MRKNEKESVEAFYTGVICALLLVVNGHGQETIAFEILDSCGEKEILRIARREGDASIVQLVNNYRRNKREQAKYRNG
jgi:hypothetical protein